MSVPNTLKFQVLQEVRTAFVTYTPSSFPDTKVIVPRRGRFDDGSEIRQTAPDTPFVVVDHIGPPQSTGQASRYEDGPDVIFERPYRSTIQIDGYGRETAEFIDRFSIAAAYYDDGPVTILADSGPEDVSALVEDTTIQARYTTEVVGTYMAQFRIEDAASPVAENFDTTLIDSADDVTLRQVNYP